MSILIYINRKKVVLQKIFFPVFYVIVLKTKLGIKLMEKCSKKYRNLLMFLGYWCAGLSFTGILILFVSLFKILFAPKEAGVSLVLPGTNIPGVGVLSFWHWIISIFILAVVHEFSHGIIAAAHRIKIKNSGPAIFALFFPLLPAAYVEPDEKTMKKKKDIVKYSVLGAGPISNVALGLIFLLIFNFIFVPVELNNTNFIGISFNAINESFPSYEYFKNTTIITEVNGHPVKDVKDLIRELNVMHPHDFILFKTADKKIINVSTVEHPTKKGQAYLGVTNIRNERRYKNHNFGAIFSWFKQLIKWLALLNIFIGLANLLPMGPLDGGLILRTFLESIIKKKKTAHILWTIISLFTLSIILLGLFCHYF